MKARAENPYIKWFLFMQIQSSLFHSHSTRWEKSKMKSPVKFPNAFLFA
jgi:hypothetical protein